MKIYTRTGDDGSTGLIGGTRVSKADPRIACTGALDELNAALGIAASGAPGDMIQRIQHAQRDLFTLGAHLAVPDRGSTQPTLPPITDEMVRRLEAEIDAAEAQLPPLRNFILPGGSETAARLHLARGICRRAERRLVGLMHDHAVDLVTLVYLNRLSDWLFVQARLANRLNGVADIPWHNPATP